MVEKISRIILFKLENIFIVFIILIDLINSVFAGDLIESTLGKLLNWNGLTANLGSMNRNIADDLSARQDMKYADNRFHSQGTINAVGAMNILDRNNIQLDYTQTLDAEGPAVYETNWNKTTEDILERTTFMENGEIKSNISYEHNNKDPVRYLTAPRTLWDPVLGIFYSTTNMKDHNIGEYKK